VGSLLPLQITKPVSSGKCGKIITYGFKWAFRYQLIAVGAPLNWISHIFWLKPLKPVFCDLKSKSPLILKIKYQQFQCERKTFQLISLSTPVSFHWTVPLRPAYGRAWTI
jgi:hypothetical protein